MLKTTLLSFFLLLGYAPHLQALPISQLSNALQASTLQANTPKNQNANLIVPKIVTFTWGKPGGDRSEYRQAKITYPVITGLEDKALQAKIQDSISLNSAFGRSLSEMEADFKEVQWLTNLEYTVNYNNHNLLSLTYSGMGMGAYPSGFVRYRSVNLTTGQVLRAHDLFRTESLGTIARQIDQQLQTAIKTKVGELEKQDKKDTEDIDLKIFSAHRYRIKHLNDFTLTPEGIIFHYEFGFPHVALALEPQADFLMTYDQLKPYLKSGSPLAAVTAE